MTRSGKTGDEIAAELGTKVGQLVNRQQLDQWTSEEKRRLRFPLAFAPAFGELTGSSHELARFVLGPRFSFLLGKEEDLRALIRAARLSRARPGGSRGRLSKRSAAPPRAGNKCRPRKRAA